jgi:RNA polymerase sigma-70 factor (ECF subfamily)
MDPAFAAALTENRCAFLGFLTRHLGTVEAAEEVLQQFYLRAVSKASHLRQRGSVVGWLYRLLNTTLVDYARREATRQRQEATYARHQALTREDPELTATVCTCLYRLLPTLKPAYADILRRVDLGGEPRQKVADDLGLTVNSVTVRLHRGRQAMKRALLLSCKTCPEHGFLHCQCPLSDASADAAQLTSCSRPEL